MPIAFASHHSYKNDLPADTSSMNRIPNDLKSVIEYFSLDFNKLYRTSQKRKTCCVTPDTWVVFQILYTKGFSSIQNTFTILFSFLRI